MRSRDFITDGHNVMSWMKICKLVHKHQKQLPFELHKLYRLWLLTRPVQPGDDVLTSCDLPKRLCEGKGPVKQGLTLDDIRNEHVITSKPIPCSVALTHKFKQDENGSSVFNIQTEIPRGLRYRVGGELLNTISNPRPLSTRWYEVGIERGNVVPMLSRGLVRSGRGPHTCIVG